MCVHLMITTLKICHASHICFFPPYLCLTKYHASTMPLRHIQRWMYSSTHTFVTSAGDVGGQLHALVAVPLWEEPHYPLDRRLGGPQSWSGYGSKRKNPCPCQELNPGHAACNLVTILILEE
jgi:hypothetical protein